MIASIPLFRTAVLLNNVGVKQIRQGELLLARETFQVATSTLRAAFPLSAKSSNELTESRHSKVLRNALQHLRHSASHCSEKKLLDDTERENPFLIEERDSSGVSEPYLESATLLYNYGITHWRISRDTHDQPSAEAASDKAAHIWYMAHVLLEKAAEERCALPSPDEEREEVLLHIAVNERLQSVAPPHETLYWKTRIADLIADLQVLDSVMAYSRAHICVASAA